VEALVASGAPRNRIRIWNLIPEGHPGPSGGSAAAGGAAVGYVLGGIRGLAAGALIGGALGAGAEDGARLPESSGVRVVVEVPGGEREALETLASCGGTNLRTLP
jgi:hypothetical protein